MFYRCKCFLTNNYFLSQYKIHVKYLNDNQFWADFGTQLESLGCDNHMKKCQVLNVITNELNRRKCLDKESQQRQQFICHNYIPKHKEIYTLDENNLHPMFVELVNRCRSGDNSDTIVSLINTISDSKRIYQLPVFTLDFCNKLIEEIDNFNESDMPKSRPNTMNNYGILLNELGFDSGFITPFREKYLNPISKVLFPDWIGDGLDSHRAFTVKYKTGEDRDLFTHFDNSEITLNVCLGKQFRGNELHFGQFRTNRNIGDISVTPVENIIGSGVLHLGQQMHGSVGITDGERHNIVIWMRSSSIRNKLCPMCDSKPILLEGIAFSDGFTQSAVV